MADLIRGDTRPRGRAARGLPRRVLLVTEHALRGGAETSTLLLGQALEALDVDVSVAFGWRGEMVGEAARRGLRLPLGTGPLVPGRGRLRVPGMVLAARSRFDVVHVSALEDRSATAGLQALKAGRPVVAHLRSPWSLDRARVLHEAGASVITNSTKTAEALRSQGCSRVHFVANGVDVAAFEQAAHRPVEEHRALRASIGVPDGAIMVLCVANMAPYKAIDALVPVVDRAMQEDPRLHFVHVGEAYFASTSTVRTKIEAAVAASAHPERFHLLGTRSDVAALTAAAELAAVPSTGEGTARAILEAWSAGVPVVAADVPGLNDLVVHGETGHLVRLSEVDAAAATLLRTVQDEPLRAAMVERGREAARGPFSHDAHVAKVLDVYRSAAGDAAWTRTTSA